MNNCRALRNKRRLARDLYCPTGPGRRLLLLALELKQLKKGLTIRMKRIVGPGFASLVGRLGLSWHFACPFEHHRIPQRVVIRNSLVRELEVRHAIGVPPSLGMKRRGGSPASQGWKYRISVLVAVGCLWGRCKRNDKIKQLRWRWTLKPVLSLKGAISVERVCWKRTVVRVRILGVPHCRAFGVLFRC